VTETSASRAPLTVETDLDLTIDGTQIDVRSTGDRLYVEFPSLRAARTALSGLSPKRVSGVVSLLKETDLSIEVRSRNRTVLALGADAPAGALSRWLGAAPAQIRVAGLAAALGQELAAGVRVVRRRLE
jgi:hypothetical protein